MTKSSFTFPWLVALVHCATSATAQTPLGPGFTHQGQLKQAGQPFDGSANLVFRLFDVPAGGTPLGSQSLPATPVADGLFTVRLNGGGEFGSNAFNGDERWLEVEVNGTTLAPRQQVAAAPYALRALAVQGVDGHSLDAADGTPVDAVFVDAGGNVGVGTLTPSTTLDVNGQITSSGASGGTLRALNPTNQAAVVTFSWLNNVPRIRIGGTGAGATNGFDIQRGGDTSLLRILDNGAVGIGVTNPSNKLTVNGSVRSLTGGFVFPDGTIQTTAAGSSLWSASGADIFNSNTGNVGVGTTTPGQKLHVAGNARVDGTLFASTLSSLSPLALQTAGTTRVFVDDATGNVGVGTSTPSLRLHVDTNGIGAVYARASATSGTTYGGWFENSSDSGFGIYAEANAGSGGTYGVFATSSSLSGTGIYGQGNTGVSGRGITALRGEAPQDSGVNYGLRASTNSPDGFAGYFEGTSYFSTNVGIGTPTPTAKLHVAGTPGTDGIMFPDGTLQTTAATAGEGLWTANGGNMSNTNAGNVGIGTTSPATKLDVAGTARMTGFQLGTSATAGSVLTADTSGVGTWQVLPSTPPNYWTASGNDIFSNNTGNVGVGSAPGTGARLRGTANAINHTAAVQGDIVLASSPFHAGVRGTAQGMGAGVHGEGSIGVHGSSSVSGGTGVLGATPSDTSGFGVFSQGRLGATGTKLFVIDHPLDPENKYLFHYCTESPEPLNAYSGNIVTDARGYATVDLPDYFETINRDFRYQLTVLDDVDSDVFVQAKVVREISESRFIIRTSAPSTKVSWRVEAVRNDPWVRTYGAPSEQVKPDGHRGNYLHPELLGQPLERGVFYHSTTTP